MTQRAELDRAKIHELYVDWLPETRDNDIELTEQNLTEITVLARNTFPDLQRGDIVHLTNFGEYRNSGKLIYNGDRLEELDYEGLDDYGTVPEGYLVPGEFPPRYWGPRLDGRFTEEIGERSDRFTEEIGERSDQFTEEIGERSDPNEWIVDHNRYIPVVGQVINADLQNVYLVGDHLVLPVQVSGQVYYFAMRASEEMSNEERARFLIDGLAHGGVYGSWLEDRDLPDSFRDVNIGAERVIVVQGNDEDFDTFY